MMSNELAEIFILFIFGGLFAFVSWRSWARQEVPGRHGRRHRRMESPFEFWFYLSLHTAMAILSLILAVVFSISLLRSSWRTVNAAPREHPLKTSLHASGALILKSPTAFVPPIPPF